MKNCVESQTKKCKAYLTDCYKYVSASYNQCNSGERPMLKKNIFEMLDKVKLLLDNKNVEEISKKETQSVENEV